LKDLSDLSKKELQKLTNLIRYELVEVQQRIRKASFPVIILIEGIDGAGKHETCDDLNEWMDPRWLKTKAYDNPTDDEICRPKFWKYWRDLPENGEMKIFLYGWTSDALLKRTKNITSLEEFSENVKQINEFEQTLIDNGALIIKFIIKLDHQKQHDRLVKLSSDDLMSWKIKASDWEQLELYDQYVASSKKLIQSDQNQTWNKIDGSQEKTRSIKIAQIIIEKINQRLKKEKQSAHQKRETGCERLCPQTNYFNQVDLSAKIEKKEYKTRLKLLQSEISNLQKIAYRKGIPSILIMEGWDAAGKGGAVRRLTQALDSRQYEVIPIAAPTKEELSHHYLWRFWSHIPAAGRIAIFDRSWYGRVLVERIEGFATKSEWQRAYREINQFEQQLLNFGAIICKFWVHISQEEQLQRFKDREQTPHKKWKLNDEDWRNREKWNDYLDAAEDMFELSGQPVPWTLVSGNQKYYSRVSILEAFAKQLRERLESVI
jgi:polyphosphate:AMP phosphotransferase